jgi:hypothetical protein
LAKVAANLYLWYPLLAQNTLEDGPVFDSSWYCDLPVMASKLLVIYSVAGTVVATTTTSAASADTRGTTSLISTERMAIGLASN